MLRRQELAQNPAATSVLRVGEVELDQERFESESPGEKVDLTPKEFELLHLLMQNPGKGFNQGHVLIKGWDFAYDGGSRTSERASVASERKSEENPAEPKLIETVTAWDTASGIRAKLTEILQYLTAILLLG